MCLACSTDFRTFAHDRVHRVLDAVVFVLVLVLDFRVENILARASRVATRVPAYRSYSGFVYRMLLQSKRLHYLQSPAKIT